MDINTDPTPQNAGPVKAPADDESRASLRRRHETTDVSERGLLIFAVSLLTFLFVVLVAVAVFFKATGVLDQFLAKRRAQGEPGSKSLVRVQPDYQGPRLQIYPEKDLHAMQRANNQDLGTYGWVDRVNGVVRVPIDRAMELVAERGLPPVSPGLTVEQMQAQRADPQVYGQNLRP